MAGFQRSLYGREEEEEHEHEQERALSDIIDFDIAAKTGQKIMKADAKGDAMADYAVVYMCAANNGQRAFRFHGPGI